MITISELLALGFSVKEIKYHMPPMIQNIARATDDETALKFAETYTGKYIYLSSNPEKWDFSKIVGVENAGKIISLLGGDRYINVPPAFGLRKEARFRSIHMLRNGASIHATCAATGVARSTVKIWKRNFVRSAQ